MDPHYGLGSLRGFSPTVLRTTVGREQLLDKEGIEEILFWEGYPLFAPVRGGRLTAETKTPSRAQGVHAVTSSLWTRTVEGNDSGLRVIVIRNHFFGLMVGPIPALAPLVIPSPKGRGWGCGGMLWFQALVFNSVTLCEHPSDVESPASTASIVVPKRRTKRLGLFGEKPKPTHKNATTRRATQEQSVIMDHQARLLVSYVFLLPCRPCRPLARLHNGHNGPQLLCPKLHGCAELRRMVVVPVLAFCLRPVTRGHGRVTTVRYDMTPWPPRIDLCLRSRWRKRGVGYNDLPTPLCILIRAI